MPRSPQRPPRATLASLAAELNISRTTVSNAYNRPDQLSADLRDRVLAAAKRLGYPGPDPLARSLRTRRAEAVGLVITEPLTYSFSDPAAREFVAGLAESCEEAGQGLLLVAAGPGRDVADGSVLAAGVDGFVVYAAAADDPYLAAVRERGLPTVIVDQPRDVPGASWVGIDDRAGMRALAEAVIGCGHRELGLITTGLGPATGAVVQPVDDARLAATRCTAQADRIAGVRDAMAAAGLDPSALTIVETLERQPDIGGRAADLVLQMNPRLTALMCTGDALALSAMDRLRGRGIYVPGQLSVTGFDGVPEALRRGLTTVAQPTMAKGRRAGRLLLNPPGNGLPVVEVMATEVIRGRTLGPPG